MAGNTQLNLPVGNPGRIQVAPGDTDDSRVANGTRPGAPGKRCNKMGGTWAGDLALNFGPAPCCGISGGSFSFSSLPALPVRSSELSLL